MAVWKTTLYLKGLVIMRRNFRRSILSMLMVLAFIATCIPVMALADGEIIVTTGEELDAAIKTLSAENSTVTIVLANDIDAITSATYAAYTTGAALTINGNGHTIDGKGAADTGLRFGARGQDIKLTLNDIVFTNMSNDDRNGGGAIAVWRGNVTVSGCTFAGNVSSAVANTGIPRGGAGVMLQSSGNNDGKVEISNSTFVKNTANGNGAAVYGPAGTMNNVTVVGNKSNLSIGGISGAITVTNSIVSGNATDSETAAANVSTTTIVEDGNNIIDMDVASWLAASLDDTNTLALLEVADSPAVDKANPLTATIADQRGILRDETPDIGAYELVKAAPPITKENIVSLVKTGSGFSSVDVALQAHFPADEVNLVEFTLKYNSNTLDVSAVIPVAGAIVQKVVTSEVNGVGLAKIVVGVTGGSIAADELTTLANVVITPKQGQTPASAYIAISAGVAYAAGEVVEYATEPNAVYSAFTYKSGLDVNADGVVNGADLSLILAYFGATSSDSNWGTAGAADVNNDGVVDSIDVTMLVDALYA